MNTNQIKKFACEARNILKRGIAAKITTLGFDAKGNVAESMMPQLMQGGSLWKGELQTEGFYRQWMALYHRVQQKGIQEVYEEAAYRWFNRLMAIRIMQKNGLCEPVLVYTSSARTPRIVDEARMNRMPQMREETRTHLMELLDDDTKVTEQFALLISAWCHANPIMQACFGTLADYTELLLPQNILAEGGFVDMINHTEFITDDDFHSPELIGWLYQFYISERKDEVFAKKGKFEADEIPAATQIFTPNWIVKYMVQNTVGRIFLDNNPGPNPFKDKWQYLVDQEQQADENIYRYNELTDLKVADLACGSGHILNECFDILYDLYIYEGYSRNEAIENIFAHNLTGIDLDNRAKQLATFALMIKACQKDSNFVDAHVLPHVLTMPKPLDEEADGSIADFIHHFFQGTETKQITDELVAAFDLMKDADSLGSIMKFDISESTRFAIVQTVEYWKGQSLVPQTVQNSMPAMELIITLTQKYSALVMNPPYMGGGNMNSELSKYVKDNYEDGKADLCTVFVQMAKQRTEDKGSYGFIIPPSWLFLSTFEKLRKDIIDTQSIESMLHLSRGVFGADFGAVSFVIKNHKYKDAKGTYFRLVERTFQEFDQKHLQMLFEQTLANHDFKYCFKDYDKNVTELPYSEQGNKIYYPNVSQNNFEKIPGSPIGYHISDQVVKTFTFDTVDKYSKPSKGMMPGSEYLRNLWEVSKKQIETNVRNHEDSKISEKKWYPYYKGGSFRRWYGNKEYVVDYQHDGERVKVGDRNPSIYFKDNINWSKISSGLFSARTGEYGSLYDDAACQCNVFLQSNYHLILGLLNSKFAQKILWCKSQTFNYISSEVAKIPIIIQSNYKEHIDTLVQQNVSLSRQDWDAHEPSWDFQTNELIALSQEGAGNIQASINDEPAMNYSSLELLYQEYQSKWTTMFHQLHANEEELNRQFIDIYDLADELTPDVPLNEITILQQGEVKIVDGALQFQADVVIKQLISYAVGVWMGRYRLDKPGLYIAHPNAKEEEIVTYPYRDETLTIDDDGIIPILPSGYSFDDNLCRRIADFVRIAFGADSLTENLNFMEKCLGTTIEQYVMKDFWKDHKRMYQNRPIYWLFSSKKGAFKCITYMHRMTPYTAEQVRSKYLLPYIEQLQARINDLESRAASLTTAETRHLTALKKIIEECQEYHERLQVVAEDTNITDFDLDDGVMVNYAKYGDVLQKLK